MKYVKELDLENFIIKHYFEVNNKKYNEACLNLLSEKVKKIISLEFTKKYTADLAQNLANVECVGEACDLIHRLRNYIESLPYL